MPFLLDIDKTIEAALYIINRVNSCDIHKLFKILYFAEQKHLAEYGRSITGDTYLAMENGPVPGFLYDAIKYVRGDKPYFNIERDVAADFDIFQRKFIGAKKEANLDYLSQSDIDCINNSIKDNGHLNYEELTQKSHDDAWHSACENDEMDVFAIAACGGANTEMLRYIDDNISNQYSFNQ